MVDVVDDNRALDDKTEMQDMLICHTQSNYLRKKIRSLSKR